MIAGLTADNFFSQLVLLIFAVAFVSGIVIAYSRAWHYLETNQGLLQPQRRLIRIALPVIVWLLGGILCLASLFSSDNRHLYASIGVFLIAFPVLDIHLSNVEYWARGAVLVIVWELAHWANVLSIQNILVSLGLIWVLHLIHHHLGMVRYRFGYCFAAGAYVSLGFWLTYPGLPVTDANLWLSIGIYMIMTVITCLYWIGKKNHDQLTDTRNQQQDITPTTLYASYERDVNSLFEMAQGTHTPMTVAIINIDRYADVNNRYGQRGANAILGQFETLLQHVLQQYSTAYHLFRSGGSTFNAIFTNATPVDTAPILMDC